MKLRAFAQQAGVRYETAWRWFKAGKIKGHQLESGTIIVCILHICSIPYIKVFPISCISEKLALKPIAFVRYWMYYKIIIRYEVLFIMQDSQSAYVTPEDAAKYFDTTPEKIRRLCREGKIPGARKLGREWRIPRSFLTTDIDTVQRMAEDEEKK